MLGCVCGCGICEAGDCNAATSLSSNSSLLMPASSFSATRANISEVPSCPSLRRSACSAAEVLIDIFRPEAAVEVVIEHDKGYVGRLDESQRQFGVDRTYRAEYVHIPLLEGLIMGS